MVNSSQVYKNLHLYIAIQTFRMKIFALVAMFALVADGKLFQSMQADDDTTAVTTEPTMTTTTSTPLNDCPDGWIYGGEIGCFYFNTDAKKVTT